MKRFPGRVHHLSACVALAFSAGAPLCALAYSGTPYTGAPIALPATFQAVNFDKGGQGVAYNDLSKGNAGGLYRTSEDVDIYASTDSAAGPYQVAYFQTGEWTAYTVNVPASGNYDISIHASNNFNSSVAFHVEVDGVNVTGSVPVPVTGGWATYQWAGKTGIPLGAGTHVVKLVSDSQYFNVSAISIVASAGSTTPSSGGTGTSGSTASSSPSYAGTPYTGTPIALPIAFQAANFDKGGEGVAYHDLSKGNLGGQYRTSEDVDIYTSTDSVGGPYQIANFQTGEWLNYTVNVPVSGSYDISVHAATNYSTPTAFHVEVDGQNVTGSIPVPITGGWSTYQWVGKTAIPLTAGKHVLKVVSDSQYFNFSAISVLASAGTTTTSGGTTTTSGGTTTTSGGTTTTSGGTTTTSGGTTTTSGGTTTTTSGGTTTSSYSGTPYTGTPVTLPATFMAANFDKGGQGVAYNDLTGGNSGGQYRTSEDVDITTSADSGGGGYAVNGFQTGEWLNYTVNVPASGNYDLGVRAATNYAAPTAFHMEVDGQNVTGSIPVPITGGWSTYQWVGKTGVPLTAGKHVLKVASDAQYFNMSAVSIAASGTTTSGGTTTGGTTSGGTTSGTTPPPSTPSSLIFWSGYEGTTALGTIAPTDCWGNGCYQSILGTDSVTGAAWPPTVSGGPGKMQLLANPATGSIDPTTVGAYTWAQMQTVTGHKGNQTKALYQEIDQMGGGATQAPQMLLPASEVPELYISQWVKLQPDLLTKMAAGTWRDLFEWKTYLPNADTDYRVELAIVNYGGGTPIWQMRGDGWIPSYSEFWRIQNTSLAVPVGQWFKLEVYWKRSSGSDGRVWMAVNGQVIGEHDGPNMGPANAPINRIMMTQLYSGSTYPIYQWVDDLQIWSTFPTAKSGDAWYDPPYAPH